MNNRPVEDNEMPAEIDFSKGVRGLHHIPAGGKVFLPVSIERSVWEYFSGKAEQRGVDPRSAPDRESTLSTASKRNAVMTGLWRASTVRW